MPDQFQKLLSPNEFRSYSSTAPFRYSAGLWSIRKALNAENAVFSLDISPEIDSKKGTKLTAFDVIYRVSGGNLTAALTDKLVIKTFANLTNPMVTPVAVNGSAYPTATAATTYVVHRTLTNPVFLTTNVSGYNLELTFACSNATVLDILGLNIAYTFA